MTTSVGRDANHSRLQDLYRFDTRTFSWTKLAPVNFDRVALHTSSSTGASFMLSSWGLLRFGGLFRQPAMTLSRQSSYDNNVFLMDPFTLSWTRVNVSVWPFPDGTVGDLVPAGRYLASAAFVPAGSLSWKKSFSYRILYDQQIPSNHANYEGSLADSIFVFGGHDGASGATVDGSSGGLLIDAWMLRLAAWSTSGSRQSQQEYINRNCAARLAKLAVNESTFGCVGSTRCDFKDLILFPFCRGVNQTML